MSQDNDGFVSATVRRWQLTETLKRLREEKGLTIEQAVNELSTKYPRWSRPKLSRIESRKQGVKPRDIEQLLTLYDADTTTRDQLLALAETANERGWWLSYRRDLPEDFHPLFNLEVAAIGMRQFETMLIPGLLQTADYARTVISGITPGLSSDEVDRRVAARLARQQILSREKSPEFHVILDETILERPIGRAQTMRAQLRRLVETADRPNITIQVLPKSIGVTSGLEGPFLIMSLPEPIPDIGYAEGVGGGVYLESVQDVRRCTLRFGMLIDQALSPRKSSDMIASAADRFD